MPLKGAIFDLDGVIVNTVPLHFRAWKKMFGEYGKKFTFKDYRLKVDGILRVDGARAILGKLPQEELDKAASKKQKYFLRLLRREKVKVYNSTINLIKSLKRNNVKVAAISSSKNCRYILKKANIDNLFDAIITGNDIKRGKPHPDIFLLAAKKLGLQIKECIVFEDAVLGIRAAKRAKMKTIGVNRHRDPARLKQADLVIGDLKEINLAKLQELVAS